MTSVQKLLDYGHSWQNRHLTSFRHCTWCVTGNWSITPPMTSPEPSYDNVFSVEPRTPWIKLADNEPLSQLHTKFWGRPIQDDEPELQMSSEGQPMDDSEDQSEVGPGCFTLELGISEIRIQKLWVRKDYIRIYEYCNSHYNEVWSHPNPDSHLGANWKPPMAPSIVITGQPGIGDCFSYLRSSQSSFSPFMDREKLLDILCRPPTPRRT